MHIETANGLCPCQSATDWYTSGSTKDEDEVGGSITIPEVAHDTEEDEYVVCLLQLSLTSKCLRPSFIRLLPELRCPSLT